MRKQILLIALLGMSMVVGQKDVTVPDINSFDSSIGSQSAVNMSNGKLSMPLKLVSLKGFKDLNVEFGIAYDGSQVARHVRASNEVVPTGVLGLGWGMQMPRILADNKLTAARDDDDFYMFGGGALNELVAISKTSTKVEFRSKVYKPWKITFYPAEEKWEVIKENGYKYTYDYVDWVLYWENWIGNSNAPGARRQGSGWSLTSVEDMYGNKVTYDYFSVMRNLLGSSSSSMRHTEATYLQRITGPMGERVELSYGEKSSSEYYEPNINASEPDAYQEIYETKYLSSVKAYDTDSQLLYTYGMSYSFIGSGQYRKRLLTKVNFTSSSNETQTYREFVYDTNPSSEFYGMLRHQILPTKGRVSYQYAVKDLEVNQIFDISGNDKTSFVVQKDYVLKFTYSGGGYNSRLFITCFDWDGRTWRTSSIPTISHILANDEYLDAQVLAREDFFAILYRRNGGSYYLELYGRKSDGITWERSYGSGRFHTPGAGDYDPVYLLGGDDFFAIGNPKQDRINMYRWNGNGFEQFYQYNNTPGSYYYTASNNYVIQHNKDTDPDTVKMFYYDITHKVQQRTFNAGLETSGSGGYPSYWYGSNSFAQVNANGNPEYFLRWDKDYNFLAKDTAPFGAIPDDIKTQGFYNGYYVSSKEEISSVPPPMVSNNPSVPPPIVFNNVHVTRYTGNGNWEMITEKASQFLYEKTLTGFGNDFYVYPTDYHTNNPTNSNSFNIFNANIGQWYTHTFSSGGIANTKKLSFDVFGNRYAFADHKLYKQSNSLGFGQVGTYPTNTIFSKSDGNTSLYLSSRNDSESSGSAFAMLLSVTPEDVIEEVSLPADLYLRKNPYRTFPSHALGYGTFVLANSDGTRFKIYKLIDGKLQYSAEGNTVQKDIVIAKETFDPVISRKQHRYYCFSNPQVDKQNMRVFYGTVIQQNDLEGVLGSTATFYDTGETDIRKQGLPLNAQVFDDDNNLLSQQRNNWKLNHVGLDGSYYISLSTKETNSFEGGRQLTTTDTYSYKLGNGLMYKHRMEDSEGNVNVVETKYLYEVYPQVLDDNLLQPVAYTRSYVDVPASEGSDIFKSATAVDWDISGIPYPKSSYAWNGGGSTNFDFDTPPDNFREGQEIMRMDSKGNILQEKNRSDVIASYIYGYGNKRLVAKIEGASYDTAIALVNNSIVNAPLSDDQLIAEFQNLRDGLPNAYVTSYTYHPSVGMTTMTDTRGRTTRYEYDSFYRLSHVTNHEGNILRKNDYTYRESSFTYSPESTTVLDCAEVNTDIVGNPDGEEPEPFTLRLTKQSGSNTSAFFTVSTSGSAGTGYELFWSYRTIHGNVSNFPYTINGTGLSSSNPNCNEGQLSVSVRAISNGTTIASSNIVNHTYSDGPDCNHQ